MSSARPLRSFAVALIAAIPLAALTGAPPLRVAALGRTALADTLAARFARCVGSHRQTCVVDGDTIWLAGDKIRLADINAPETHMAGCDYEQALGERATDRLVVLLNEGPFSVTRGDPRRDRDRYGRLLRVVSRDGRSLGAELEAEGLAEHWHGHRRDWCS